MLKYAQVVSFATDKYPFDKVLAAYVFKVPELDRLHVYLAKKTGKSQASYEDNLKLRRLMQNLSDDSLFYRVYHKWVREVVAPKFGYRISYSAHPKMRVHLAGTGSVSEFHRDADVTGRPDQINCYLPFTDVSDTNTLWCESSYGLKDYRPINLKYGEALIWDGGFLEHGTFPMKPVVRGSVVISASASRTRSGYARLGRKSSPAGCPSGMAEYGFQPTCRMIQNTLKSTGSVPMRSLVVERTTCISFRMLTPETTSRIALTIWIRLANTFRRWPGLRTTKSR